MAREWLYRSYPPLSSLAGLGAYPEIGMRLGRRRKNETARNGLRLLALDVRRITIVCGQVLATGRPVEMRLSFDWRSLSPRYVSRLLRAVLAYEQRHPHRGTRGVLRRALREAERRLADDAD